jgi:hypothetical protein
LIALACEPVTTTEGKTTRSIDDIRQEAVNRGVVQTIGWTTIQRILAEADIRPHLVQGWVHSPDPQFREKVTEICDLYLNPPPGSVVISVDEKTGMQALERRFPDRPAAPGRLRRREFEYTRHGTQSLLCGFNVHTGKVIAACGDTRTGADLVRFMEGIAMQYPDGILSGTISTSTSTATRSGGRSSMRNMATGSCSTTRPSTPRG